MSRQLQYYQLGEKKQFIAFDLVDLYSNQLRESITFLTSFDCDMPYKLNKLIKVILQQRDIF